MSLRLAPVVLIAALVACNSNPKKTAPPASAGKAPAATTDGSASRQSPYAAAQEDLSKRGDYSAGGLYAPHIQDSAPDDIIDVDAIPEPVVKYEPLSRYGNRPYKVLGNAYSVLASADGYVEQGIASYYGKKFHGRRTSSLEVYDMYAFSAAHKSLPLPSYARVTNLSNGKSVVVRVNDRGPFHAGRIIDLSYAAAVKLGVHRSGVARVEVRGLSSGATYAQTSPAIATPIAAPPPKSVGASAIDTLVQALPIASAAAAERAPATTQASPTPTGTQDWRFDMRQDGRTMSADEFDAWMKSRRARVATGKPGTPDTRQDRAVEARAARVAAPKLPPIANEIAVQQPGTGANGITLQVAAFAARTNAEHALAMLRGAGIDGARLQDGVSNGQPIWRLRVGPVASTAVPELTARFTGLGFGQPQIVRE